MYKFSKENSRRMSRTCWPTRSIEPVDSRDGGKHSERNDLLFVEKSFYSCVFIVTILYLRAVVRAKTVNLSVWHIACFTIHFCILYK